MTAIGGGRRHVPWEHPQIHGTCHTYASSEAVRLPNIGRDVVAGTTLCGIVLKATYPLGPGEQPAPFADSLQPVTAVYASQWCRVCRPEGR